MFFGYQKKKEGKSRRANTVKVKRGEVPTETGRKKKQDGPRRIEKEGENSTTYGGEREDTRTNLVPD